MNIDFKQARVWVAGDVMLDKYWQGPSQRISPEAPVPVVQVQQEQLRAGGAGNVAVNLAQLGVKTHLFALLGQDETALQLQKLLEQAGVQHQCVHVPQATITKLRIISHQQQLLRLDFEQKFNEEASKALFHLYEHHKGHAPVLILSDYAKGSLQEPQAWIEQARSKQQKVLVDPKGQDFSIYRGAYCITPNLAEFEAVVGTCADLHQLEKKGRSLLQAYDWTYLLITRGEQGMSLISADQALHLPTDAREVYDVTGAGDTVIATLGAALAAGQPMSAATSLANLAAGIAVGKLGTAAVSPAEINQRLWEQRLSEHGIVSESELVHLVASAKQRGERIVFTNGCFDLLHAGHVSYLQQAAELGDRLIVAVNTDEQVRRLKGQDRPINTLQNRMQVLAALGFVDWVVPFSEPTPERLICRLQPDYLVKGGDNDPAKIPGGDCVRRAGGEVKVMPYVAGISTTELVKQIKND